MNLMDCIIELLKHLKIKAKSIKKCSFETAVLPLWFWALLIKALEAVLNWLHVLVVLTILKLSATNGEYNSWKEYYCVNKTF